jgi:arsenite oxidase small subunit
MASETKRNGRRKALKIIIGAGILAIAGVVVSTMKIFTGSPEPAWPRLKVINAKSLQLQTPLVFDYPALDTPNIIVKLGVKADNGIGPDGDIVAFSRICQHHGCIYSFYPPSTDTYNDNGVSTTKSNPPRGQCPCHGSVYDFAHNAAVIGGPAPNPVPRVLLEYDQATGDIYVVGMGPPNIYGRACEATDSLLKCDVGAGQIVTQITLFPQ